MRTVDITQLENYVSTKAVHLNKHNNEKYRKINVKNQSSIR